MKIGGEDLLAQIENDSPKQGIYLRRYILPALQSRGLAGHVLATPTDKPGPVELMPISSLVTAGENVAVTPTPAPSGGGSGAVVISAKSGVTSVGLAAPARLTITGSPVTSSGTITISDTPQPANLVFAGPVSGPPDVPAFRALVAADIPAGGGGGFDGTFTTLTGNQNVTPIAGASITQIEANMIVQGGGLSLGGATSNTQQEFLTTNANRRGIKQTRAGVLNSHAVGDSAGGYFYARGSFGVSAGSDEGATAITGEVLEDATWFHGTVSSTAGTGDSAPVLAHTTGANYTIDGGYLLNITKGTLNGTLTGVSAPLSLTINSGSVATFLNFLTVSGVSLPVSTAIGIATAAISPALTTRDVPVAVTITVNLAQIGGIYHLFTNGSIVSVAGSQFPEQSIVSAASGLLAGNQQTFTLHVCNPNAQAVIFQGGIQGQYISSDANLASGVRSAYFAFGSLTGTDLIYGNQVAGGLTNNTLPNLGCEFWTATGANSAWHLYPGAEVVKNTDSGFACQIETNAVAWTAGDVVECAKFPTGGGATGFFVRQQFTPSNGSYGMSGLQVAMSGPGTSGANTAGIRLTNGYATPTNYMGSSGPLQAPNGVSILGQFANPIYIQTAPDASNNAIIMVQNHNTHGDTVINVIQLNWAGGGNLSFDATAGRWHVDKMDAAYSTGGTAGVSGTIAPGNTATVVNGIITAIV